jgi:hypothetical protein
VDEEVAEKFLNFKNPQTFDRLLSIFHAKSPK